jgi:RNA polymerase sigma factor (sigma-70 family)
MKTQKRPAQKRREHELPGTGSRREDLFDRAHRLARRAAEVRSSGETLRYVDIDREDLVQEGLISVWTALDRFDISRASLRTFVERVVSNKIGSVLRRARTGKRTQPATYRSLVESQRYFVSIELHLDLVRVLKTLGHQEQNVARLLEDHRPAEIARELRISRPAVYRCMDRIREAFAEAGFT